MAGYVAVGCVRLSFDFGDFRIKRIGERASFGFIVACGYALANAGTIRALFRIGLGIGQFSIPCAIPS